MSKSENGKRKTHVSSLLRDAVNARIDDQESLAVYPALMELLLPVYEGTTLLRQAGRLSIRPEGPTWIITIDCPTEVLQTRFACGSLKNALQELESAILSGTLVWLPGWQKNKKPLPTVDELIQ